MLLREVEIRFLLDIQSFIFNFFPLHQSQTLPQINTRSEQLWLEIIDSTDMVLTIDANLSGSTSPIWRINHMLRRFAVASVLLIASSAAPAMAGTATSNLSVSASVTANCTISTSALSFGAYDPISANASSALTGTGTVTTICTNGSSATITLGQGSNADTGSTDAAPARRLSDGGTNFLAYTLYQDAARTTVWGNTAGTGSTVTGTGTSQNNTIYGSVVAGQNVPAGSYSDTVVATVSF